MTIRIRLFAWALLIASAAFLVIPNAQSNPKAAKKKAKTTAAETSPAPEATPSLEPKALDILKAASSRLYSEIHRGGLLRELESPWPSPFCHDKIGGHSPATRQAAGDHVRRWSGLRVLL